MRTLVRLAALASVFALVACGDGSSTATGGPVAESPPSAAKSAPAPSASVASNTPPPPSSASAAPVASASASSSATPATSVGSTTPAPSTTASGEPVVGEKKGGPAYSAFLSAAKSYKAGKPGAVTVVVSALEGYHVNQTYPYKMKLDAAPAGVSFPADTIRDVARSEKRATMTIPFNADAPGTATISGSCSLSVCTEDNCVVDKVPLSVTVKIE
jgi:hypothetical protein